MTPGSSQWPCKASMRPGFYTRKSPLGNGLVFDPTQRFNEAGILHPEKRRSVGAEIGGVVASMRPGFYTRKSTSFDRGVD